MPSRRKPLAEHAKMAECLRRKRERGEWDSSVEEDFGAEWDSVVDAVKQVLHGHFRPKRHPQKPRIVAQGITPPPVTTVSH